ncbi:MAG: MarR family transcriptional regulator [Anaerolineaceae bacterium]|nr:MarR family transcriptional regulator [Anaerolineaceae bacterium]
MNQHIEDLKDNLTNDCARELLEIIPFMMQSLKGYFDKQDIDQLPITMGQSMIIHQISLGKKTISDLAMSGKVSAPAVSRQVDGLVNKGFLTRQRNENDRRMVMLDVTEQGKELMQNFLNKILNVVGRKLSSLDDEEICAIRKAFASLRAAFEPTQEDILKF